MTQQKFRLAAMLSRVPGIEYPAWVAQGLYDICMHTEVSYILPNDEDLPDRAYFELLKVGASLWDDPNSNFAVIARSEATKHIWTRPSSSVKAAHFYCRCAHGAGRTKGLSLLESVVGIVILFIGLASFRYFMTSYFKNRSGS